MPFSSFPPFSFSPSLVDRAKRKKEKVRERRRIRERSSQRFAFASITEGKSFATSSSPIFCRRVQLSESRPGKKFDVDVEGEKIYAVQKLEHGKQNRLSFFKGKNLFGLRYGGTLSNLPLCNRITPAAERSAGSWRQSHVFPARSSFLLSFRQSSPLTLSSNARQDVRDPPLLLLKGS